MSNIKLGNHCFISKQNGFPEGNDFKFDCNVSPV